MADGKPLPGWLSFNPQTRTFSGTPGNDDVGMLNVEISAKGKGGSANQRFTLNVINVNDAPQAGQKLPTLQIEHNKLFYYQLPEDTFKDIDKNDKLTFSATSENGQSLPSWLKFDAYNGTFTGSPSANTPQGNYRVTVTVTDSGGLKAHQTLVLNLAQGTPLKPVNGTDRNDVLISSADNELLAGKGGKDVYQFSRGFGHDLINNHDENSNQDDVVTFTNMNRKDFLIMRDYTSLYLRSLSGTDELRIMGQFPANSKWRIGEIRFADGSILTADEIERELQKTTEGDDHIYGSKDNDIINGKGGNDVISGEEGDDELYGEDGNDNLIGSVGNDKLSGGAGEDSLNGGDGRDHLSGGAGNDELIDGEDDDQLHGNEGDDKLYGGTGNDLLIGDSGNDVLSGSAGNDIYRFARGFGHDVINNYDGGLGRHDSIDFSDMNRSDFDIRREGNNLVLHSKDGKNQITVTNHFFNGWQIDSIRFADGTTLDHGAINSAVSTQNAPRGNYMHPAAQALQMNQMIASLNNQAQPLHALAIPDEKQPLLAAVNPY
ncbi:type I secretion target GGXGXDXXX repeat (2 copies) [Cardiobacterium hominis ATCC 15826]|uniref:Type I secretion target GGXGXDXXX repeat (2 copies) n=1 Tax=Cardiobacterium hominis (strain ATCC 15826 / DSM 8339 / NCTC 10426 / 6573) TaxID=638300 RepID=C8N7A1_CARH6|nr:type I secretion target GGXGXDXXX repeat (2 copies) [Cardiobacterium hominis ATCC 15826]